MLKYRSKKKKSQINEALLHSTKVNLSHEDKNGPPHKYHIHATVTWIKTEKANQNEGTASFRLKLTL